MTAHIVCSQFPGCLVIRVGNVEISGKCIIAFEGWTLRPAVSTNRCLQIISSGDNLEASIGQSSRSELQVKSGASIPQRQGCISALFQIPPTSEKFSDSI